MFNWKKSLTQLFAATVNQEPLEDAADLMVAVSSHDADYHMECLATLKCAIDASGVDEKDVILAINKSGYKVTSMEEAKELLMELQDIYKMKYSKNSGK